MKKFEPNQISLDLETLGVKPSSIVLSIGMARFDPNRADTPIVSTFYRVLSITDQEENQRTVDESTMKWWEEQSEAARQVLVDAAEGEDGVHEALMQAADWMGKDAVVWGNGAAFDNTLLSSLYDTYEFKRPWSFRNDRCMRTLRAVIEHRFKGVPLVRDGVHHNALDDAIYQAKLISQWLRVA